MTKEEAIEILNNTSFFAPSMERVDEAIDMAIEALSAEQNCDNCKEYGSYKCTKCDEEMYYKTEPSDLISRTELIKTIKPYVDNTCRFLKPKELIQYLNELPSVSTERVGEWVDEGYATVCSNCGTEAIRCDFRDATYEYFANYCPNCGARMRGKDNE